MFDWIVAFVSASGYAGVATLMFAENVFPPIPSELIMPLAGFVAARGELSLPGVVVAGTLGSLAGMHLWYELGRRLGVVRLKRFARSHGRWLTLAPREIDAAEAWFVRRGEMAVLFGRLLPTVRTLISVPAGVARLGRVRFLAFSAIGSALWTAFLAVLGYALEANYTRVVDWVNPFANAIVAVLVLGYLYRVVTFERRQRERD